ncbi:MAG: Rieske (2Fe-2S) protein [Chitinophagaceae bacterium]|nr:Rieske (2Fe-2S) protein [Chitinophagaceae bacterium]
MTENSRRNFIKQASMLGAGACCLGTISIIESCTTSLEAIGSEKAVVETPGQITLLKSSIAGQSYTKLSSSKFRDPIFLNINADGTYSAVLMNCTHKGCSLAASQGKFVCPCHGSEFDLTGHVLTGPAKNDLQSFQVTSDDLHIIVKYQ